MRDFHQLPPDGPHGEPVGTMDGDGGGVLMTVSTYGAVMTPVYPGYSQDEFGGTDNTYQALCSKHQAKLYAAGCP